MIITVIIFILLLLSYYYRYMNFPVTIISLLLLARALVRAYESPVSLIAPPNPWLILAAPLGYGLNVT